VMLHLAQYIQKGPRGLFHGVIVSLIFITAGQIRGADGDWELWTEASWSQRLDYGLELGMRSELRFERNISEMAYYETEAMLTWHYSPRWDFAMGYERDEKIAPDEEVAHVPSLAATLKIPRPPFKLIPILDWSFASRLRTDFMVPEEDRAKWEAVLRNRTGFDAEWRWGSKQIKPFLFDEWFFGTRRGEIVQNRFGLGVGIPLVAHWDLNVSWMRVDRKTPAGWEWHPVINLQIGAFF
jgi:hypothetical protein